MHTFREFPIFTKIRNCDVAASLKSTKRRKTCGVDGIADEHFIFVADQILTNFEK